ncbi:HTH domain-containing protein [Natrarchaeobius sp. A-rgal3]|uniref:HTH domain-containing protein n=1 Tax=Natrarchaeobius versutus TaxID=1679078 RepID=UPI00350F58C2
MQNTAPSSRTVELWIRSFAPATTGPTQERALERLERLESATTVDVAEVRIWGPKVEHTDRSKRIPQLARIQDRLEAFESWAARTGRRLEPFFRRSRCESTITGERHDVHRLPTIAIAEFEDGELVHVAPCVDDDRTIDVFDRFDALEGRSDDSVLRFGDDRRSDAVVSDRSDTKLDRSKASIERSTPDPT